MSKARRLRLLVGTFVLALSVILTGCSGSVTQEREEEKMKMLKKKEEKEKEKKKEEWGHESGALGCGYGFRSE